MGKAVACQLAAKGANIVLVARTVKKLQDALDDVKVKYLYTYALRQKMLTFPRRRLPM
jgi:3-dehydrosphinganine reductase